MKPLSNKSFNCSFSSFNTIGYILYGGLENRQVSGMISLPKSISLSGGTTGRLSGKTCGNSLNIGTD